MVEPRKGTTCAAFPASLPQVILEFLSEAPFWGQACGGGPEPVLFPSLPVAPW